MDSSEPLASELEYGVIPADLLDVLKRAPGTAAAYAKAALDQKIIVGGGQKLFIGDDESSVKSLDVALTASVMVLSLGLMFRRSVRRRRSHRSQQVDRDAHQEVLSVPYEAVPPTTTLCETPSLPWPVWADPHLWISPRPKAPHQVNAERLVQRFLIELDFTFPSWADPQIWRAGSPREPVARSLPIWADAAWWNAP